MIKNLHMFHLATEDQYISLLSYNSLYHFAIVARLSDDIGSEYGLFVKMFLSVKGGILVIKAHPS